jgi:hypothetical protein
MPSSIASVDHYRLVDLFPGGAGLYLRGNTALCGDDRSEHDTRQIKLLACSPRSFATEGQVRHSTDRGKIVSGYAPGHIDAMASSICGTLFPLVGCPVRLTKELSSGRRVLPVVLHGLNLFCLSNRNLPRFSSVRESFMSLECDSGHRNESPPTSPWIS